VKLCIVALMLLAVCPYTASAHNVSRRDATFVQSIDGPAIGPFLYLGAKHMVTGYDHLMFLVGVIFFLYRLKDVVQYVSLFTIGHSVTLLAGVLGGIRANAHVIDAIIGLSVVYKAFENMGGFERVLGFRPNTRAAVMVFGLFSWVRSCHQAPGVHSFAERPHHEHRQLQCRRGDRTGAALNCCAYRHQLLADAKRIYKTRLCREHRIDDRRFCSSRISVSRILPAVMTLLLQTPSTPSGRALAKATIVSMLVASVTLVSVVLPAEYGTDPLGTGRALGLANLLERQRQRRLFSPSPADRCSHSPPGTGRHARV